jgi:transposase
MHNNSDDALFDIGDDDAGPVVKAPAGRSKVFRSYDRDQSFLMPPSLDDWLSEDHTARFISETVDLLDLSVVYDSYVSASGAPPYDPQMMLRLLFYGYSTGVTSSREMEKRCHVDVAFRWLTANSTPDYRSIARFRRRHLVALDDLFTQVLVLCSRAGLVKLGRVALDGTKLRASASKHKAMSYSRLGPRIEQLQGEVAALLAEAEATDRAEDEEYGEDMRGDEVPDELARRETRLVKMRAAKEAIEADAAQKAAEAAGDKAEADGANETAVAEAAVSAADAATPTDKTQRSWGCQFVCVSEWRSSLLDDVDSVWEVDSECVEARFPSPGSGAGWSSSLGCDVTHSEVQQFQGCFLVGEMAPGLGDLT